ncbi:MAG: UDP-3-O-(3-hydroxymyristoyl)glucosamine N-acyltransferase [Rhodospirillum sp.]|nr:UDP-3-O-(3-hydroxymyristoyl)glucosamine N-acyltransferase [Rhodospirillum sp.]MCF8490021.1 UDP-3-O-(3-hydroxymyristoyl)glucosamine N-acyltransferase [Rhodospirillum sp.]MCF8498856.1 UDP-3-O-(3-hydroxymyristoyl)glucosamine N-acyltransferase [Rhodospirillum sp.]
MPMKTRELAQLLDGQAHGDADLTFERPTHPDHAGAGDLAVALDKTLLARLSDSAARIALVGEGQTPPEGSVDAWVSVGRPRFTMHLLTRHYDIPPAISPGVHPFAVVEDGAVLGEGVAIGPFCHIGRGARIGDGCRLVSAVTIGADATVGPGGLFFPGARVGERVTIGALAIIHSNAVIGADGFSFGPPEQGAVESAKASGRVDVINEYIVRVHSLGAVTLGDDVEIGANTCIDRGTLDDTRIGSGTKVDDLVMIGHNVKVGRMCMLCAQVGIAGSAVIGDGVVLAGRVGVADHITIGDNAVIGAGSGVGNNVPSREVWVGYPAMPKDKAAEQFMMTRRMKNLFKDVSELKKRVRSLPGIS